MSKAIERTNEIVGQLNDGDWTDHSGQNAHWSYFCEGYAQAEKDIIQRIDEIFFNFFYSIFFNTDNFAAIFNSKQNKAAVTVRERADSFKHRTA